jgi:hypothetical protein
VTVTLPFKLPYRSTPFTPRPVGLTLFLARGIVHRESRLTNYTLQLDNNQVQVGVNAFVVESGPTCHAFSDNAALKPLGNDFTNTVNGVFTSSNGAGDVGSNNQGVPIGAFFCSLSKAAVDAQVAKGSTSSSNSPPPSSSATVRIQNIFDNSETATQEDIPFNALFLTG